MEEKGVKISNLTAGQQIWSEQHGTGENDFTDVLLSDLL